MKLHLPLAAVLLAATAGIAVAQPAAAPTAAPAAAAESEDARLTRFLDAALFLVSDLRPGGLAGQLAPIR